MQHDAGPGALLRCPPAPGHPGTQAPYFSTNASAWLARLPAQLEAAPAGLTCALRLLAATEQFTPLLGLSPNPGLQQPGRYEVRAMVGNGVSRHNLSCSFNVLSPVAGLRVIYPPPHDGRLYVPTNGSALVLQVDSGANATAMARWPGGNVSAPFEATCPIMVAALVPGCDCEVNATLFSVLVLPRLNEGEHEVDVVVENGAGRANLSLQVKAEEPIRGLRATPSPEARVLQGVLVVSVGPGAVQRRPLPSEQAPGCQDHGLGVRLWARPVRWLLGLLVNSSTPGKSSLKHSCLANSLLPSHFLDPVLGSSPTSDVTDPGCVQGRCIVPTWLK